MWTNTVGIQIPNMISIVNGCLIVKCVELEGCPSYHYLISVRSSNDIWFQDWNWDICAKFLSYSIGHVTFTTPIPDMKMSGNWMNPSVFQGCDVQIPTAHCTWLKWVNTLKANLTHCYFITNIILHLNRLLKKLVILNYHQFFSEKKKILLFN